MNSERDTTTDARTQSSWWVSSQIEQWLTALGVVAVIAVLALWSVGKL